MSSYWAQCGCPISAPIEVLKEKLLWGTYGPPGAKHPLKDVLLKNCSTEHLWAILTERADRNYWRVPILPQILQVIVALLKDRNVEVPASLIERVPVAH